MARVIFNNAFVLVSTSTATGTRDISNRITKLSLERDADEHDDTVMGLTAHSTVIGLEKWQFAGGMIQSFSTEDSGENTDQLLSTLYDYCKSGGKFLVNVRVNSTGLLGPANPTYSGLCVLKSYKPLDGSIGDLLKTDFTFLGSGNLSRSATSSG